MRKIIPYLLSLSMAFVIAACVQPVGTTPAGDNTSEPIENATQFYKPVERNTSEQTSDAQDSKQSDSPAQVNQNIKVKEKGNYTDKERVAMYIHTYGHLPPNYITKAEAQKLGWNSSAGNLRKVAPGKSIGGDKFGNYEGQLPKEKKRKYYECDIDYGGGKRNAKRIIFSNDGLIFYTGDHYKTFQQLY